MKKTSGYYSNLRPEIVDLVPKNIRTILDVGCGHGDFLRMVKEKTDAETWGIEIVNDVAENAREFVDNVLTGKVEDNLSFLPDGYFECISFNDLLEHLVEPAQILTIIRPKLSDNGIVIASIPNVRYIVNLYELLVKKDWEYKEEGILDSTHLRFFTRISMKRMFEEAGYYIISQQGINPVTSWKFKIFNLFTLGIFNDTKYMQFACIARSGLPG